MYNQMEYSFESHVKIISNGFNERKNIGPTTLDIYKHGDSYVKYLIFVMAFR